MKIEVLGTGCAKCQKLLELVQQVVADAGVDAQISKVERIDEIMKFGVPFTPALVIEGKVVCAGKLPKPSQIQGWLLEA